LLLPDVSTVNNQLYNDEEEEAKNRATTTVKDDADGAADQVVRQRNVELIIKRSPKLLIEVVESQTLPKGELVTLNAFGMESQ
jgi:hypothetical protein